MPQGSKEKYTAAQKRKAEHIEQGYEQKGVPHKRAEAIAWATVNKQDGGGNRTGSGKTIPETQKIEARKDSARNAVATKHEKTASTLESATKKDLLARAAKENIPNRSTMNKTELIQALRKVT